MKLAWSAIVRNEIKVIDRCVNSLLPYVDYAIVTDTGSTDGTARRILELFAAAGKAVEISMTPFVNFSQARNSALHHARASSLPWDWLLLVDADMELKANRPDWFNGENAFWRNEGLSYDAKQTAGGTSYFNRRLLSRKATGCYAGVTHEFLNVETAGILTDIEFIDHADGSNRPDKFARDIALLEEALKTETRVGLIERYHFYLGQSYFDAKNWIKAAEHYGKRTQLGGFEEERWTAQRQLAHCYDNLKLGDSHGFVSHMLRAYELRPHRAEALYDLAKYFRLLGKNFTSLMFSELGMRVPYPKQDTLFVNDWVYEVGLKEEFSICAYYDPDRRWRGGPVCNELSLSKTAGVQTRQQARHNQFWYLESLDYYVPLRESRQIELTPPDGYVCMNPSVINYMGEPWAIVRTVNYTITPEGVYAIRCVDGSRNSSNNIHTRNFLVCLDDPQQVTELEMPRCEPEYLLVRGFEDSRLFQWNSTLWTISTVREWNKDGWCEQVLARVVPTADGSWAYGYHRKILPEERRHEKNWAPWVDRAGDLRFVYRLGTLVDRDGKVIAQHDCKFDVGHMSGGSQVVDVGETFLMLVHEARTIPGRSTRYYQHRWVSLNEDGSVAEISLPFFFFDRQIEFVAGLAFFPETRRLLVSLGVRDAEAWLVEVDVDDVLFFIGYSP